MLNPAVMRIRDVYPGSKFFPSRIQGWQNPGSGFATRNLSIFNPKIWYQVLKNKIRDVHPVSRIPYWSQIQIPGPGAKIYRIPDPPYRNPDTDPDGDPGLWWKNWKKKIGKWFKFFYIKNFNTVHLFLSLRVGLPSYRSYSPPKRS
jgi:hypothetical protein